MCFYSEERYVLYTVGINTYSINSGHCPPSPQLDIATTKMRFCTSNILLYLPEIWFHRTTILILYGLVCRISRFIPTIPEECGAGCMKHSSKWGKGDLNNSNEIIKVLNKQSDHTSWCTIQQKPKVPKLPGICRASQMFQTQPQSGR